MTSSQSGELKYNRARVAIMRLIAESGLQVGDSLPSLRDLTKRLSFGMVTVRHALLDLAAEGVVEIRPKSGMYLRKTLKDNRFSSNFLFIFVTKRGEECPGPGLNKLRQYLALHGIGLNIITVFEFGLDIVEASKQSLGIMLSGWLTEEIMEQMQSIPLPQIVIGNYSFNERYPSVSLDLELGCYRLARLLITEGHRRIMLSSSGLSDYTPGQAYISGYTQAMSEFGIEPTICLTTSLMDSSKDLDEFLDAHDLPDAVIMEPSQLYDLVSWYWRHGCAPHPAIALLAPPANYRNYRQCPQLRCLMMPDLVMIGAKLIMNHVITNMPLVSQSFSPSIPGIDDDCDYFVH